MNSTSSPSSRDDRSPGGIFADRHDAGNRLAPLLRQFAGREDVIVLGLARGGVPVACEVARALGAPLDVFIVRKLGVPGQRELAMGAIASGGVRILNRDILYGIAVSEDELEAVTAGEQEELQRREHEYRIGRPALEVRGKTVILVDDGLATGASMRAAIAALRARGAAGIVAAVPIGSPETCAKVAREADELICAARSEDFHAVGQAYDDFSQTTGAEVRDLLARAASHAAPHSVVGERGETTK